MNIQWVGCSDQNFGKGRGGNNVGLIVLHWIVGTLSSADATFANPTRQASAHYGIGGSEVHQYVKEEDTAWHCGNLTKNKQSIGIEHEGGPDLPVSEATVLTSIQLVADICRRYNLPADADHIKRHSDIKSTQCPGALPVERIIQEANKLLQPAIPPTETPVNPDKVKVDLGDLGVMEVQAIRSEIKDLRKKVTDVEGSYKEEKTAKESAIKELNRHLDDIWEKLNPEGKEKNWPNVMGELEGLLHTEEQHDAASPDPLTNFINALINLFKKK